MYYCKCGHELESRGASKHEGENLFTCTGCGEKWQERNGNLYQVKVPTYLPTSKVRTVRLLDKEHDGVVSKWGSLKNVLQWASRHNPPKSDE